MATKTQSSIYGEIPSHWSIATLKDVCVQPGGVQTGPFGSQLHQRDYQHEGTPIITVEHLGENRIIYQDLPYVSDDDRERLIRYTLRSGDIVFSRVGSVDRRALVREAENGWLFSGRCLRVRPDSNYVNSGYLSWFFGLPSFKEHIRRIAVGATMPSLNTDLLSNVEVILPPLSEQQAIAHILGTLDDKIELNQQMNRKLEAIAQAIFKSWFVDFDPVRAKMEGRQPAGMDAETAALFPDLFEDSQMGKIPKGWRVAPLPEVVEVNPSRSLSKGQIAPYLDMKNMPTQGHRPDIWINRPFSSGTKFINGDTLLARITPCLENGKTAFVDFLADGQVGWGSTEYLVFRPKPPLPVEYGYYLARSEALRAYTIQNMTGSSGRQRAPAECFWQYLIAVPLAPIAQRFEDSVKPLMAMSRANSEQSRTLTTIRDTLLPKLMSGEIRVKDAEKIVEAAA